MLTFSASVHKMVTQVYKKSLRLMTHFNGLCCKKKLSDFPSNVSICIDMLIPLDCWLNQYCHTLNVNETKQITKDIVFASSKYDHMKQTIYL